MVILCDMFITGESAMAIGPAVMVIYIIMGAIGPSGVGKALPAALMPLRTLSPMNHACSALVAAEFRGVKLEPEALFLPPWKKLGYLASHVTAIAADKILGKGSSPRQDFGDEVLASLGIGDIQVSTSVGSLFRLFIGHVAASFIGLILFRPRE